MHKDRAKHIIARLVQHLNPKGFSMVGVMVAAGMLGGLSLAVSEIISQIAMGRREIASVQNQFEIQKEIALLLSKPKHCKASMIWQTSDGTDLGTTESFQKINIDDYTGGQARRVELWTSSDANGARGAKKFADGQAYGRITVKSIMLSLDSSTSPHPLGQAAHTDLGTLHVVVTKKIGRNTDRDYLLNFPLEVEVTTSTGAPVTSIIQSCWSVARGSSTTQNLAHFEATNTYTFGGVEAGDSNTTGTANVFMGYQSGKNNTAGSMNTFLGHNTGVSNMGNGNTFVGAFSGLNNTYAVSNTFVGFEAGRGTNSGGFNAFFGRRAGAQNSTGQRNTFLGANSGELNSTGSRNIFIGFGSGNQNTTGTENIAIGYESGYSNQDDRNVFVGFRTGYYNSKADNTFIGHTSGQSNTSGEQNTFLGSESGFSNTSGVQNTFVGYKSGRDNDDGQYNTFVGSKTGNSIPSGHSNTFLGYNVASHASSTGSYNTYVGKDSGRDNTSGSSNAFLGIYSGAKNTSGYFNTYLGGHAGRNNLTGMQNTFVGYQSALANTSGNSNICVGYRSCITGNGDNRVVVGFNTTTNQAYYKKPGKPGDGNIVFGQPEDPKFLEERIHSLAINNIIEGSFSEKWVLIKDDLKVKRDLDVGSDLKVKGQIHAPFVLAQVATPSDAENQGCFGRSFSRRES